MIFQNNLVRFTSLCLVAVFLSGPAKAGTPQSHSSVGKMKAYCDELDRFTLINAFNGRVFLQDTPQAAWRERKTQRDESKRPYREAKAWFRNASPAVAFITQWKPDQQWVDSVKLYFRADGTLIKSTFESIGVGNNQTAIMRVEYFDAKGKSTYSQAKRINRKTLKTQIIRKPTFKIPLYRTWKELPFSKLLAHAPHSI
jgi:hypothetical protein